jgi:hypothetical protein
VGDSVQEVARQFVVARSCMQADIEGIKQRDVMQSNKEVYLSQLQCAWQTAFGDMEQPQVSEQSWMNGNTVTFPQGSPDSLCGPSFEKHQFFCFAHRYISWNVEVSLATMQEMAASQRDQSADKKARDETKEHSKKHKKYKVLTPEYLFV